MLEKNNSTIYFSHGKESGPNGNKINYLTKIAISNGFKTESIDYTVTLNPDIRIKMLLNKIDKSSKNIILYGSSMGAYVSLVASKVIKPKKIFICAPALYMPGYKVQNFDFLSCPITIIQGRNDKIVDPSVTIEFAEKYNCDLYLTEDDHSLSKSEELISNVFREFLEI